MSTRSHRPRGTTFGLTLRIYLIALLPFVATSVIIGVVDFSMGGPPSGAQRLLLPLGILLLLLAVAAALFARSLAVPIARLTQTAAEFGDGNLEARTGLDRKDEIGALARAFDEMADRVTYLMHAQKKLLADVSHELRTPLARIRVALDIVDPNVAGESEEDLRGISEDLVELERLVASIMMTAQLDLEAGRAGPASLPLRLEQTEARAILDEAVTRFRRKNSSREIDVSIEEPLPLIEADRVLVRRVVDNLLDNARKYSDAKSVVSLRGRCEGQTLQVEVEDTGIGIDQTDIDKIFTPFFRTDQSRNRSTGGVGLGLSLSRQIVEAHGGTISIESKKGRGTLVRFSIPGASAEV